MTLPTLSDCFARYDDTDKGGRIDSIHSYDDPTAYPHFLDPIRLTAKRILEVGVRGGGSLKAWQDYFPNLEFCGGIDNGSERGMWTPDRDGLTVLWGDSTKPETLYSIGCDHGLFDLVVDDGDHSPLVQIATFAALRPFVAPGGLYVVEDLEGLVPAQQFVEKFGGEIVNLIDKRERHDDLLVVIRC